MVNHQIQQIFDVVGKKPILHITGFTCINFKWPSQPWTKKLSKINTRFSLQLHMADILEILKVWIFHWLQYYYILNQSIECGLFHTKITARKAHINIVAPAIYTWPNFFLYIHSPFPLENKEVVVIARFLSKLDHRSLFNLTYYETILVWGLVSIWLINAIHCL